MRVSVFGLGYVGCVTSACLAQAGHETLGVDVNREKVAMVNQGAPPRIRMNAARTARWVSWRCAESVAKSGRSAARG